MASSTTSSSASATDRPGCNISAATYTTNTRFCCLPGHLCLPCSTRLAAGQRPPGSSHLGCPTFRHATASARRPPAALPLHRSAGSSTARPAVRGRRRRLRCCQRGRKPAVSERRIPGQQQRQTPSSAAQPPPRDIQTESGFPPGVFQLSGPAAQYTH